MEGGFFEEPDEAALEAKKTGGTDYRGLHELVQFSGGTEFKGNLENFVELVRLGARHAVQLSVGDRHRTKAGQCRDQGLVFLRQRPRVTGIDENRSPPARAAKERRAQNT